MIEALEVDFSRLYRPHQVELRGLARRFNVWACHRRFGKSVFEVGRCIESALSCPMPEPRVAYVAPYYKQAKRIAWDYAKRFGRQIPGSKFNESELRVDFVNGGRLTLYGADNPDSIRGIYLDHAALDEYAFMNPSVWSSVIRPMLTDRKGSADFCSSVFGKNHFHDMKEMARKRMEAGDPEWFYAIRPASMTGIIDPAELAKARADLSEEEYLREFECDFDAPVPGAYYAALLRQAEEDGRITDVPWIPDIPVHTAWDIGFSDDTAIWFYQVVRSRIHLIDYYAASGEGIGHYVNVLHRKPYTYGRHNGPHDLVPQTMASNGRSVWEQAKSLGITFRIAPSLGVNDGINAVRRILPRCWWDKTKCEAGLDALRLYRREWDDGKQSYKDKPLHDWTSHPADSMRYLAVSYVEDREDEFPGPPRAVPTWNEAAAMIDRGARRREWA